MDVKQGYKTTEFWLTIATFVFSALVMLNVLNQDEAADWLAIIAPLLMAVVPVVTYTIGRAKVKSS